MTDKEKSKELREKIIKATPEKLRNISAGQLFALVAAVAHLAELLRKDKTAEPLPDVENRQAITLLPLTILTSSRLDARGRKLQAVALGDDPALDPSSPDFDPQAYKENLQAIAPQITEAREMLRQYRNDALQVMADGITAALLESLETADLRKAANALRETFTSALAEQLGEDESRELLPYIMQALDSPKYADTSEDTTAEDWQQLIQEARQLREDAKRQQYTGKRTTKHNVLQSRELALPFDIFNPEQNKARDQVNGQITMLPVSTKHHGKELTSFYTVNFKDTLPPEIAKHLDYYDRLVYGAIDSVMHYTGSDTMTIAQIYRAMGGRTHPTPAQTGEIWQSLQKMQGAFIWYDFHIEQAAYQNSDYSNMGGFELGELETGAKKPRAQAGEALLSFKAISNLYINGNLVDAIKITDTELPIYRAARARGYQVAAVPIECLQLPGRMQRNNRTLAIVFAALEQISKMKNPKKTTGDKMLYSTIYSKCGLPAEGGTANERKQRQRVRDTLFAYLEHLKQIGYIDGYRESKAGEPASVTILFKPDALPGK